MPDQENRLVFESFGMTAEVTTDDPQLLAQIEGVLPPGWGAGSARPQARFSLSAKGAITINGERWHDHETGYSDPLVRLGSVVRHHMALYAPAHTFVHAGVVALDGALVVLPGPSHAGKTTLVAALIALGAVYYSDEYAVVDAGGLIHPYPKALSVRTPGVRHLGHFEAVPPERIATRAAPADLIVSTWYEPGARWRAAPTSPAAAAQAVLANTPAARSRPQASMAAAGALARDACAALAGPRGEAPETAAAIREAANATFADQSARGLDSALADT